MGDPHRRPSARREQGSGAVLVLGVVAAVLLVVVGAVGAAGLRIAEVRVATAADAAAVGAAAAVVDLVPGDPCDVARRIAAAHRTELVSCRIDRATAHVDVGADVGVVTRTATAVAGPPDQTPGESTS